MGSGIQSTEPASRLQSATSTWAGGNIAIDVCIRGLLFAINHTFELRVRCHHSLARTQTRGWCRFRYRSCRADHTCIVMMARQISSAMLFCEGYDLMFGHVFMLTAPAGSRVCCLANQDSRALSSGQVHPRHVYVSQSSSGATPVEAARDGPEKRVHGGVESAPAPRELRHHGTARIIHQIRYGGILSGTQAASSNSKP